MNMAKIKKLVKEYEHQTGIEAQNFRQLEIFTPESVNDALAADVTWHIDNTQEMVYALEKAQNFCFEG